MTVNLVATATLCHALVSGEHTVAQLSEITGMTRHAVARWLKILHSKKLVHICEWRKIGHVWTRVWAWEFDARDAVKPARKTPTELCRQTRQNRRYKHALFFGHRV